MNEIGLNGLFSIFVTLGCVALSWVLLQEVRFDRIFHNSHSPRARMLHLLIAIIMGHMAAGFVLDYWQWSGSVKWLFRSG
ncbi:MAG: hypothetical protein JWR03_1208 [Cohnella sp.]|jgi:uncharacterized integral membrane protein (TIGR02327 family)|nr:hypothetical protein [Cohnella sp.]